MWIGRLLRASRLVVVAVAFFVVGYLIGKRDESINIWRGVTVAQMDWQPNIASKTSFILKGVMVTGFAHAHLLKGNSPIEYTLKWHGDAGLLEDLVMEVQVETPGKTPGTVVTHQCGRGFQDGEWCTWRVPDLVATLDADLGKPPYWGWMGRRFVTLVFRFPDGKPVAIVGGLYLFLRYM